MSLWDWSIQPITKPPIDRDLEAAAVECWMYRHRIPFQSVANVRPGFYIDELAGNRIQQWLHRPIPELGGVKPQNGFRGVVLPVVEECMTPISDDKFGRIAAQFGLPRFDEHYGSTNAGACGMFREGNNGSFGNITLMF